MKNLILFFLLILSSIYFGYCEENNSPEKVISDFGTTPIINGIIEKTEWQDAKKINLNSTKFILLKHDNKNLYFAFNGDGGNIYFLKGNKVVILHSSFSLGSAEYSKINRQKWSCIKEYQFVLFGLQKKAENEIRSEITGYLKENGWVASLIPMGNRQQSEFAVSFQWLGIAEEVKSKELIKIPKIFISSFQNLPPAERKGRNLKISWPVKGVPNSSINRGYSPKTIDLDISQWGGIDIKIRQKE